MAKVFVLILLLVTLSVWAQSSPSSLSGSESTSDVNDAVSKCLSMSSTTAGTKTMCVQNAINAEETKQINTLYGIYSQFVAADLENLNNGGGGSSSQPGVSNAVYPQQPRVSAPAVSQPAPSPAPPAQAPRQNRSGIQYY